MFIPLTINGTAAIIHLSQGRHAIVDVDDWPMLAKHKWIAHCAHHTWYARRRVYLGGGRRNARYRMIAMHKELAPYPIVDHRDGNGWNNRRLNLRSCTHGQNKSNARKYSKASSRFKGVHWHGQCHKWQARICINKKRLHLGVFDDEIEAAKIYDDAAREHFGEFARTNFPQLKQY